LASTNLQQHSTFSIIKLHISLPTKVAQCLNAPLSFGSGIHIKRDSGTGFLRFKSKD
jgi:hypothetical protein